MSDRERAEALFFESNRRLADGDDARAEAALREALLAESDLAEAHANLGLLLDKRGAVEEAEACHRQSIRLDPRRPETNLNLGANLAHRRRFAEAEAAYREALRLDPESAAAWSNLGVLYACTKREAEAEACYRHVMARTPDHAKARFNLSYLLLRQGRYEEGWNCFESRGWYAIFEEAFHCPRWRGEALTGKTVIVAFESGFGDMIQFVRYVPILKQRGAARVDIVCHPPLKPLFATLEGADAIFGYDEALPVDARWDFWTPPLSLPGHCGTRTNNIPATLPYLHADPVRMARWAPRLPSAGLRVGLVWKGNPRFENDDQRSLPHLDTLAPLWQVPGVSFVSLQKGADEDEAAYPPVGQPLLDLGSELDDFADTAAVVAQLDLVVSVDTGVAHLAGALAKPCWVLLPDYKTDWRWLTERSDSPWYPGVMRLFRQPAGGDWQPVVAEVSAALEALSRR